MLNMRLAQYNLETGKFEKFLKLGKDFLYGGDFICFHNPNTQALYKYSDDDGLPTILYNLDEKDPLNRFDGFFNGRTYGGGRFVLIAEYKYNNWEDDVFKLYHYDTYDKEDVNEISILQNCFDGFYISFFNKNYPDYCYLLSTVTEDSSKIGNIHENPELFLIAAKDV